MKRIVILIILISYIYCSSETCNEEIDQTKCESHQIQYNGFSCYKVEKNDSRYCMIFPDNIYNQEVFWNFSIGLRKEIYSGSYDPKDDINNNKDIYTSEKKSYQKGEEIILIKETLTNEDINLIKNKKTCTYYYFGKFIESLEDVSNFKGYPNITDKNICFNAEQFNDLKDLIDCGYATITYKSNEEEYTFQTCFYIPNDNMPNEFNSYLKDYFIDPLFESSLFPKIIYYLEYYDNYYKNQDPTRRLSTTSYKVTVEDKKGKKVKYTSDSNEIEILKKTDNTNLKKNNSSYYNINSILYIILILLIYYF